MATKVQILNFDQDRMSENKIAVFYKAQGKVGWMPAQHISLIVFETADEVKNAIDWLNKNYVNSPKMRAWVSAYHDWFNPSNSKAYDATKTGLKVNKTWRILTKDINTKWQAK